MRLRHFVSAFTLRLNDRFRLHAFSCLLMGILQRVSAFPALGFIFGICPIAASRLRRTSSNLACAAQPFLFPFTASIPLPLGEHSGVWSRPVTRTFKTAGIGNAHGLFDVSVADFHEPTILTLLHIVNP